MAGQEVSLSHQAVSAATCGEAPNGNGEASRGPLGEANESHLLRTMSWSKFTKSKERLKGQKMAN